MGAYDGVSQFFGLPLDEVAEELGYDEDNILVLRNDEQGLEARYPQTYQNILSCKYQADRRTPMEYARDLVASWLIEDYFLERLQSPDYTLRRAGADRERKILPRAKVSASSDFLIQMGGRSIKLELMNDYTGFWEKHHVLHLRDDKYERLEESGSLFIAIAVPTGEFAIYDFREEIEATYIPSHRLYGGKPAYALPIPEEMLCPIEEDNMAQAIAECMRR